MPINNTQVVKRDEIRPGDIVFSVGTLDPRRKMEDVKTDFDEYNPGSYNRLAPLLTPVRLGQSIFSHSYGSNDTVHVGVCLGVEDGVPIVTDIHGKVTDHTINTYYKSNTLVVYRPLIGSEEFVKAVEDLYLECKEEDIKQFSKEKVSAPTKNYYPFPGRHQVKWDSSKSNLLRIALTPSNFLPAFSATEALTPKTICSKFIIELYKILLSRIAKNSEMKNDQSLVNIYMNLMDNSSPKTLEGYLKGHLEYQCMMVPTEKYPFEALPSLATTDNQEQHFWKIYDELAEKATSEQSSYQLAQMLAGICYNQNIVIPPAINTFLQSQGIVPAEQSSSYHGIDNMSQITESKKLTG